MAIPKEFDQIISGPKVRDVFNSELSFAFHAEIKSPSQFMSNIWNTYNQRNNVINGKVFEAALALVLVRCGLEPLFTQAKLAFIPNVEFDFVLYSDDCGPIVLSAKTSLRERYKQSDLEGMMLRQVHRKSQSYLLTMDQKEAPRVVAKLEDGTILGIDEVVLTNSEKFDDLIQNLRRHNFIIPDKVT